MDILEKLGDLHKQATVERSHYYTANAILEAIYEISVLRCNAPLPAKGQKSATDTASPKCDTCGKPVKVTPVYYGYCCGHRQELRTLA